MLFIFIIISLIITSYFAIIILFILGNNKTDIIEIIDIKSDLELSIIIPFRNEEQNIETLIESINNQTYSKSLYELILVDDFSEDKSFQLAITCINKYPSLQVSLIKNTIEGKKSAINQGISKAKNEFIVLSDADCIQNKEWISCISSFQFLEKCDLIIGPVKLINKTNLFGLFQDIEFLSLQASTIGSAGIKNPILCNGANLGFNKNIFSEKNLKTEISSGDDVFFLHELKKDKTKKIRFLNSQNAIVETKASSSIQEFLNQRIRWTSKSLNYSDIFSIISSFAVLFANFFIFLFPLIIFLNINLFLIAWGILILKIIIDFLLLKSCNKIYKVKFSLFEIIFFEFIYSFYVVIIAFMSFIPLKIKWKNRNVKY